MVFSYQIRMDVILYGLLFLTFLTNAGQAHERTGSGVHNTSLKHNAAIDALRRTSEKYPQWIVPKIHLARAFVQKARETGDFDDYRQARSAFQDALALNPRSDIAMTGLAWVHGANHNFDASIRWASAAIVVNPLNPHAYGLLGDAAVALEDYDAAFRHYQSMLDIRPDLASYARGAHLLFVTGDYENALRLMRKAIAAGAPHAANTAWCRAALLRMQRAMADGKKVVQPGKD